MDRPVPRIEPYEHRRAPEKPSERTRPSRCLGCGYYVDFGGHASWCSNDAVNWRYWRPNVGAELLEQYVATIPRYEVTETFIMPVQWTNVAN